MACCSSVQCTVLWNRSGIGHMYIYISFMLRVTDTITFPPGTFYMRRSWGREGGGGGLVLISVLGVAYMFLGLLVCTTISCSNFKISDLHCLKFRPCLLASGIPVATIRFSNKLLSSEVDQNFVSQLHFNTLNAFTYGTGEASALKAVSKSAAFCWKVVLSEGRMNQELK
jgi:hypothetical protein